jgi:DNA (cytosine-5)-methyltransferase 1
MVRIGSLFSGIGGLELGLEQALRDHGFNARTVFQVEKDDDCRRILATHWPDATRHDDVCNFRGEPDQCDLLCGGFPCQDVSIAGKGAGLAGDRSGLWFEFSRLIREIRPRVVIVENVAAIRHPQRGGAEVLGCLAESGYDAVWFSLRASDVGAPHQRERVFFVGWQTQEHLANAHVSRLEGHRDSALRACAQHARSRGVRGGCAEPLLGGDAHGLPARLDAHAFPARPHEAQHAHEPPRVTTEKEGRAMRLKALGNAVVPQCGYVVGCVVAELMTRMDMDNGATT